MELIELYRDASYKTHFEFTPVSTALPLDRQSLIRFLQEQQKGNPVLKRLTIRDLDLVMREVDLQRMDYELSYKLVIQKANLDVCRATIKNGVTTRLLFLFLDCSGNWRIYGYAKARYNNLTFLNVRGDHSLGFSLHASLQEKQTDISGEISDTMRMDHILKKLTENGATRPQA